MMSKRRQTLGIQIVASFILLMTVAYYFIDPTPPTSSHLSSPPTTDSSLLDYPLHVDDTKIPGNSTRVKAAFVILARNSDLDGIRSSIRQMEDRFNKKFNYPYVFLNDEEFTDDFKELTSAMTNSRTLYGKIDPSHWGYPPFIDQERAVDTRRKMADIIYGGSESYRHMCRYQSGFFFRHPLLEEFEYYWRVEPDINYYCDLDYDVFQMMKDNDYKYGWTISLTEYEETIPTLWKTIKEFMAKYPEHLTTGPSSLRGWLTDDDYENYNGCHFWSNFEIGSLEFLRSKKYLDYFDYLDHAGGFFYERWGDAPVHALAVAMMLPKEQVHFFNDIGYLHNPLMHCPTERYLQRKCHCTASKNFDWEDWSCATRYRRLDPDFLWDEETYRKKTDPYRI